LITRLTGARGRLTADVCIIGSGPAGMTIALELARAGKRVLLCEAGGESFNSKSQSYYAAPVVGDNYFPLQSCRARQLGGTSALWAGWCRPLDDIDFERPTPDGARWPIGRKELAVYSDRAAQILSVKTPHTGRQIGNSDFADAPFAFSPPTRFAQDFRTDLERLPSLQVILSSTFVGGIFDGDALSIAKFRSDDGSGSLEVAAKIYVLACGGIENARLLMWLNSQAANRLANPKVLGRYFMEHPYYRIAEGFVEKRMVEEANHIQAMAPTAEYLRRTGLNNCSIRLDRRRDQHQTKSLLRELACVAPETSKRLASLINRQIVCGVSVTAMWEQTASSENRIELTSQIDELGLPVPKLLWRKGKAEAETIRRVSSDWAKMMAQHSDGRVKLADWVRRDGVPSGEPQLPSCHHMGGTRMGNSSSSAVVDANCRVFGTRNLYVAGSSVFVTGGYANPTMSIVEISLRLAIHIKARI
jgi:choline dehydrogenase-like flavoprotein